MQIRKKCAKSDKGHLNEAAEGLWLLLRAFFGGHSKEGGNWLLRGIAWEFSILIDRSASIH